MTQLIEQYVESLLRDPQASPPHDMDAGTAAFVRAMVAAGNARQTAAVRARMWQRALKAATPTNGTQNHLSTMPHSTNGHHINNHGSIPAMPMPTPTNQTLSLHPSSRFRGILTLAAACTLVLFGIVLMAMVGTSGTTPNMMGAEQNSGSATPTETPTSLASGTPIPTPTPPSELARDAIEYTIQPGDTLLSIVQRTPYNASDLRIIETVSRLNPYVDMSQLSPGMTILIPMPTPEPTPIPTIPGTRLPSNLAAIMTDLQSLTGNAETGRAIVESAACSACHDNETISTLTETLWQSAEDTIRRLPQFLGYTAEMYVVESIIHPSAYIVPGYTNLMPDTYRENLSLQQLADLIAYLRSFELPQNSRTATPISATVVPTLPTSTEARTLPPTVVPQASVAGLIPLTPIGLTPRATGTTSAEAIVLTATQLIQDATTIAARETAIAGRLTLTASPLIDEPLALSATALVSEATQTAALHLTPTPIPTEVTTYVIQEGDTLLEIAVRFDTTLQTLAELNPQIDFSNCEFTRFSGGANCIILLMVGDTLNMPLYDEMMAQPFMATPTPVPNFFVTSTPIPTATTA